jgi:hypothetical protein
MFYVVFVYIYASDYKYKLLYYALLSPSKWILLLRMAFSILTFVSGTSISTCVTTSKLIAIC